MDSNEYVGSRRKLNIKKLAIVFITIVYFLGMLSAHMYIIKEEHHDCSGENCTICQTIHEAKKTIEGLNYISFAAIITLFLYFVFVKKILYVIKNVLSISPVDLKVKLRN